MYLMFRCSCSLSPPIDCTPAEYEREMKAKEEAKKKEVEERLKREQEEAAAYAAAANEANANPDNQVGPKVKPANGSTSEDENVVVSAPSGKDKIENLKGEWWKSSAVTNPSSVGKEPDEEWWKDLEGLDESMLGVERGQRSGGGGDGENERFLSGGGVAGISEEDQAVIASADDPDTRRRVRSAYSNWCKMYNKEPDEGRFPKFKSNYLIMERMAMEQGREVTLNEFADCTPEEYRKAHQLSKSRTEAAETESQRKDRLRRDREEKDLRLERLRKEQEEEAARSRKASERRRNVNVARQPANHDEAVDEAGAMAEVERLAMRKAEEAARRVAAARKLNGPDVAARAKERAMARKDENRRRRQPSRDDTAEPPEELRKQPQDALKSQAAKRSRDMKINRDRAESSGGSQPQRSPNVDVRWEEERLRNERKNVGSEDGFQQQRNPTYMRDEDNGKSYPRPRPTGDANFSQPKVKPPSSQSRGPKTFPPRPSFTSPQQINNESGPSATSDDRFMNEESWIDPYDRDGPDVGPSRFKQNIMKLRRDMDPGYGPPFADRPGGRRGDEPGGFMQLESEEALIEAFEDMASFGTTEYTSPGNYGPAFGDPSVGQSEYDDPYFMDLTQDEGAGGYPTPEVSPPSYSAEWPDEEEEVRGSDSRMEDVGSDWSARNYDAPSTSRDNGDSYSRQRGPMMNTGSSYLENLSKPSNNGGQSPSSGMNRGGNYLNDLSRPPQPSSSPPPPPMGGSEFPDRIRAAYRDWCQYYDKPYNEGRLRIFAANFLAVEKYHRETGVSLILNELADMTSEEYQNRKMQ